MSCYICCFLLLSSIKDTASFHGWLTFNVEKSAVFRMNLSVRLVYKPESLNNRGSFFPLKLTRSKRGRASNSPVKCDGAFVVLSILSV